MCASFLATALGFIASQYIFITGKNVCLNFWWHIKGNRQTQIILQIVYSDEPFRNVFKFLNVQLCWALANSYRSSVRYLVYIDLQ